MSSGEINSIEWDPLPSCLLVMQVEVIILGNLIKAPSCIKQVEGVVLSQRATSYIDGTLIFLLLCYKH